jgi:hypothetical protein
MPFAVDIPRVPEATIVVDGTIDEADWAQAATIEGFTVFRPRPDTEPLGSTVVRIMSDEHTLYIAFQANDPEPKKVRGGMGRRDSRKRDDYVGLLLDPVGNGERGALFIVNPYGIQLDGNLVRGRDQTVVPWRGSWSSWDGRWQSQGQHNDDGFAVEMAIPWTSIRHPRAVDEVGAIFFRRIARTGEMSAWPRVDPEKPGVLVQTAKLGGPGELPRGKGISVIPELTYRTTDDGADDDRLNAGGLGPGMTLQYAPSSASQLLATVNPDFSQVESDEAQIAVNQRYSLQLEEKRPFFLEGQEWFDHPLENLIYTRTMVTPLYGVRATTENDGWAVAALHVWDRQPGASVSEGGGWTAEDIGEASALETVGRIRRVIGSDGMVGLMYSDRSIIGQPLNHRVFGIDGRLPIGSATSTEGSVLVSDTTGLSDDTRAAPAAMSRSEFRSRHMTVDFDAHYLAPGFRSENGFIPWADSMGFDTRIEFLAFPKWRAIPRMFFFPANGDVNWTTEGDLRGYAWEPGFGSWFSNGAFFITNGVIASELYADQWLEYSRFEAFTASAWTEWLHTRFGGSTGQSPLYDPLNPVIGWSNSLTGFIGLQPVPAVIVGPQVTWERFLLNGEQIYDGWVGRLKLEFFATPRWWARLIVDRSTFDERNSIEALFAHEQEPGKAIYLGGQIERGGLDELGAPDADLGPHWQIFTKVSWVFGS